MQGLSRAKLRITLINEGEIMKSSNPICTCSLFRAPTQYPEGTLGYYAWQYAVLAEYERIKNGDKEPTKNPLVKSRMRDAIYDWEKWKAQHNQPPSSVENPQLKK